MLNNGMFIQNRYEVISRIGSGGMADVYKAKDHKLNRFVAVKVLKKEFREDKVFISKFRVEAQSAAGLAHGNIVNIYDVGEEAGINYIVMELVEGITLKEYIADKGHLSAREATSIALQISAGLEAAHNNGIIHRDVKPQNIMISTDGKVKVADFGIARAASANTMTSGVMGSVHYSSPEQARGGYSDEKSDIYSLGITMYEMLTGHVPFDGDTAVAVALRHLQDEMHGPREEFPEIPYSTNQIVLKCTQKSPDRRYPNMTELIRDLRESLVNPEGDFVTWPAEDRTSKTIVISKDEVEQIKSEQHLPSYDESMDVGAAANMHAQETGSVQSRAWQPGSYYQKSQYQDVPGGGAESSYREERWGTGYGADDPMEQGYYDDYYGIYDERDDENTDPSEEESSYHLEDTHETSARKKKKEEDSDSDLNPKLEKAVTLGGIIIAVVVGFVFLALLVNALGLVSIFGSNRSDPDGDGIVVETAAATEESSEEQTESENESESETATEEASGFALDDLSNMELSQAQALLITRGLQYSVDQTQYSDTVASGYVISTDPEAGETVSAGDVITLYVSQGAEETEEDAEVEYKTLWSVTGYTVERAEEALEMLGLTAAYAYESSDTISEGLVTRTSADDTDGLVPKGSTVTIYISTGPSTSDSSDDDNITIIDDDDSSSSDTTSSDTTASDTTSSDTTSSDTSTDTSSSDASTTSGTDSSSSSSSANVSGTWQCNASLSTPSGYTGQPVRITLVQNDTETTVFEGTTTFPYLLQVAGIDGETTGTAYVYLLDEETGEVTSTIQYSGITFSEVS
ncbi:MAG: Stk1 family PASTA domain-containing Ser/Thr kinase [Lachnospiraceae bacterium]|nr:Stk1 family PASTA domain-containing Ser/Thr kinase [Lachnospiraceae bacterium]